MAAFVLKSILVYHESSTWETETMPVPVEMLTWPGGSDIMAVFYGDSTVMGYPYLSYRLKINDANSIFWLSRVRWEFTKEQFAKIMAMVKS